MEILYKKIANDIKHQILSGVLKPDEKLPTELELSKHYDVSRITSKKALNILQEEGLIYRVRGSGSFVNSIHGNPIRTIQHKNTIAIVLPFNKEDTDHGTTLSAIHSISEYMFKQGYFTTIHFSNHRTEKQTAILEQLFDQKYIGAIIFPIKTNFNETIYSLYAKHFPIVAMSNSFDRLPIPSVTVDNVKGSYLATQHLAQQGHTKIAFLSPHSINDNTSISDRYLGYMNALSDIGVPFNPLFTVTPDKYDPSTISDTLIALIKEKGVTGVVSVNDGTAAIFLSYARSQGLECPLHYSIVGFDNLSICQHTYPPLTTIKQDYAMLGQKAAKLLIDYIDEKNSNSKVIIPVSLIKRESTMKLK